MPARGRLIALEGIDGCGKSTQAAALAQALGAQLTFEPGATPVGARLRELLLNTEDSAPSPRAEALLMAADRAQHVAEVVQPALDAGTWVVTDRFSASTLAYQGYGRGLDRAELDLLIGWATGGLTPDLTVLIDVPVELARARRGGGDEDRLELEGEQFQRRVAEGYHRLAEEAVTPWLVVDGTGAVEEVAASVWAGVEALVAAAGATGVEGSRGR
jgi:dTMP kinase